MTLVLNGTSGITAPQGAVYNGLQMATAQPSTSGTAINFIGIPLWVNRITIMFSGVSLSGGDDILIQIGSGSFTTSGYVSTSATVRDSATSFANSSTSGFDVYVSDSTRSVSGHMVLTQIDTNVWVSSHASKLSTVAIIAGGGNVTLSGSLDRVRITPSGANTFDAGTINVMYE